MTWRHRMRWRRDYMAEWVRLYRGWNRYQRAVRRSTGEWIEL